VQSSKGPIACRTGRRNTHEKALALVPSRFLIHSGGLAVERMVRCNDSSWRRSGAHVANAALSRCTKFSLRHRVACGSQRSCEDVDRHGCAIARIKALIRGTYQLRSIERQCNAYTREGLLTDGMSRRQ